MTELIIFLLGVAIGGIAVWWHLRKRDDSGPDKRPSGGGGGPKEPD